MSIPLANLKLPPAQAGHGEEVSHVEPDDIGVGLLTVLFAFVAVVVLLVVVLLQAWFYNWKVDLMAERTGPINVQQAPAAVAQRQLKRIDRLRLGGRQEAGPCHSHRPRDGVGREGNGWRPGCAPARRRVANDTAL